MDDVVQLCTQSCGSRRAMPCRAGDLLLKRPYPVVSAIPEIKRHALLPSDDDGFIILASDGLWDVVDDQTAVDIVVVGAWWPAAAAVHQP